MIPTELTGGKAKALHDGGYGDVRLLSVIVREENAFIGNATATLRVGDSFFALVPCGSELA